MSKRANRTKGHITKGAHKHIGQIGLIGQIDARSTKNKYKE